MMTFDPTTIKIGDTIRIESSTERTRIGRVAAVFYSGGETTINLAKPTDSEESVGYISTTPGTRPVVRLVRDAKTSRVRHYIASAVTSISKVVPPAKKARDPRGNPDRAPGALILLNLAKRRIGNAEAALVNGNTEAALDALAELEACIASARAKINA